MRLSIVPGPAYVLFTLLVDGDCAFELVPAARFVDTLAAYAAALRFTVCSEAPVDEADLLAWAGNV